MKSLLAPKALRAATGFLKSLLCRNRKFCITIAHSTMVNTASLVSVTDGVSWKRIRTLAVVVAGPGTFHRYHPVSTAWVAILIQVVPLSVL